MPRGGRVPHLDVFLLVFTYEVRSAARRANLGHWAAARCFFGDLGFCSLKMEGHSTRASAGAKRDVSGMLV